jgi:transposase-like protein
MNGHRVGAGTRERLYASTTSTYDPHNDLDLIAIECALNGEPAQLTPAEKLHAARILDSRGHTDKEIGRRVGCADTTIADWRDNDWNPSSGKPKMPRPRRPEPVCGEPRMYRRHLKNGERCDVCRAANAAADRRNRLTGSRKEKVG